LFELCVDDASLDEVAPTFRSLLDGAGIEPALLVIPDLAGALAGFVIPRILTEKIFAMGKDEDNDKNEVSFLQARVEGIDVDNQQVVITKLSDDCGIEYIEYDALVIATGSEISLDSIPVHQSMHFHSTRLSRRWN